ncbi:response regulator transcription factor [Paenibacillus sp. TRM 82003]|nr:response regulator transcription factor [Paenibacillus sp. TRM 82003]
MDDELLIRQGIKHYLNWEQEGFTIVGEAANGVEALELIETTAPHIVLTDVVMPTMDGEELTRHIKQRNPGIEIIVLSSFGEFDYVRATFQNGVADYILKPKLEAKQLVQVLRATAERIPALKADCVSAEEARPSRWLERIVAGYGVEEGLHGAERSFPYGSVLLIGIDVKRLQGVDEAVIAQLQGRVDMMLRERVAECVHCRCYAQEQQLIVYAVNAEREALQAFRLALERGEFVPEEGFPETAYLIGNPFLRLEEAGGEYGEKLKKLQQARFFLPKARVLTEAAFASAPQQPGPFDLNKFAEQLRRWQYAEAFDDVRRHVEALAANPRTDVFEYKSFLSNMIFNVTVLLGNLGVDAKEAERTKYTFFNDINSAADAECAASRLFDFLETAASCIEANAKAQPVASGNMKMLLDYIEQHYAEPLSLRELAKHFHFNPSYLSSYFATHNKEGFVDYLNRVRTEKAAERLRKERATIAEISGMVGYSEHSYFCKVFKKIMGCSPSQYRRRHLHSEAHR